jgi:hypothetical protein
MQQVEVKWDHIGNGKRGQCRFCPIALATIPHFPGDCLVEVGNWIEVARGKRKAHRLMPAGARQFMEQFDHGFPVSPFSFELDIDGMLEELEEVNRG